MFYHESTKTEFTYNSEQKNEIIRQLSYNEIKDNFVKDISSNFIEYLLNINNITLWIIVIILYIKLLLYIENEVK